MRLSLDQLQVASFETAPAAPAVSLPTTTGGEDCFSGFQCLTITRDK
jgi:hypothetical protein